MKHGPILFFDSGIGGLSVVKEARVLLPEYSYIYVADDAAFPYGAWEERALRQRLVHVFGQLIAQFSPSLVVIACNTASTLAMTALREAFPAQAFVGTVPAIKPAAERTRSGIVSVLATPGTVERQYTHDLIRAYASRCKVNLVGSVRLAALAEQYMREGSVNEDEVAREIAPCFIKEGGIEESGRRTDIIVLACTHYPFLVNRMRKVAPWPVDWIDPAEAIARRAMGLMDVMKPHVCEGRDVAYFTAGPPPANLARLMRGFGFLTGAEGLAFPDIVAVPAAAY